MFPLLRHRASLVRALCSAGTLLHVICFATPALRFSRLSAFNFVRRQSHLAHRYIAIDCTSDQRLSHANKRQFATDQLGRTLAR
ncbi:hypothetical protein M433DRAFT_431197 [Acidomyces richmondensis BFW]|nr:MAG: hypothetical protein FE78DRAFT_234170 [Acidomyces sp. 'richmondensis']KYG42139.1 hypothetical protein M433DRAFT_431197 [Acidomyces richmondensis BFW]